MAIMIDEQLAGQDVARYEYKVIDTGKHVEE